VGFSYDGNGNRTGKTIGTDTDTYSYDNENRLVSLSKEIGGTALYTYAYDYRSRRVTRTEPGGTTQVAFNGGTSISESGASNAEFVRGPGQGGGVGGLEYSVRGGASSFNQYNSRGDVTGQTDGSAVQTYQAAYEAFGKHPDETGSSADTQRANTKEEDPTGLLNEGFRYRDLHTGTFITRDPLGLAAGPNDYIYCGQNPWSRFDPEGLDASTQAGTASTGTSGYKPDDEHPFPPGTVFYPDGTVVFPDGGQLNMRISPNGVDLGIHLNRPKPTPSPTPSPRENNLEVGEHEKSEWAFHYGRDYRPNNSSHRTCCPPKKGAGYF